ncbi:hypothetical protein E2562_006542 [Oryza meyeriana var. granulata]|uniref:Uncharacterized protein n=1 Tax=Oryza meyeriana var. granulata TaxID=110450 RepID=A0A6G1BU53_9ORYZ|nr:hypothetical protein E2562_006542 [Oryza meyeriana var. granulata]
MDAGDASTLLEAVTAAFWSRVMELHEVVLARNNMYLATVICRRRRVLAAMEAQVQAIRRRLQEEYEVNILLNW